MNESIRWGILGTGAIARAFAHALGQTERGHLVAAGSRAEASARAFLDEVGAEGATAHGDYEALLADPGVQAVYIATPHPGHAPWTIRAAEAGKHVLSEKPLAVNHPEAMAMVNAAAEAGTFLMEGFMYRCHPQTARLVELIGEGAIGEVGLVEASFGFQAGVNPESRLFKNTLAGGGIMDVGCYPASFARLVAAAAGGEQAVEPEAVSGAGLIGQTGVDERAVASLRFGNGMLAELATGITLGLANTARIFGTAGRIEVPAPWTHERASGGRFEIHLFRHGADPETIEVSTDRTAFAYEAEVVAEAIEAGRQEAEAVPWADSLAGARTLDRWRAAIGLAYEQEKPEQLTRPVHGRALARQKGAPMTHAPVEGVRHPVSRMVMGCDNQTEHAHAAVMFDAYYERGGNTFDTAHIYGGGRMERLLGWWMDSRGVREDLVVIGKGAHTPNCNPEALSRELLETLDRLGTDRLDIYFMHRDNPEIPVDEFAHVLHEHHAAGRIGVFGGSNWSIERFEAARAWAEAHGRQPMSVLSNNFSLARMVDPVWKGCVSASDPESRAWHEKTGTPLFCWSSQARGFFTPRADVPAEAHPDRDLVRCWYSEDNFERRRRAIELAGDYGVQPINIAAAYVLNQPFPTFALIGPRVLEELRTSLPALSIELSPETLAWLNLDSDQKPE